MVVADSNNRGSWFNKLGGQALYTLSRLTHKTGRFQVTGLEHLQTAVSSNRPILFTAWHGMTMMLIGFFADRFDMDKIVLILPDDWRGESLVTFTNKIGARPFPMNLHGESSMATARQLAKLVRLVKKGSHCYITPDGPEGPAYVIKPGTTYIAQKANALILPIGAYARHGYRLNRWDRYIVPYPFSKISIHVAPPITISKKEEITAVSNTLTHTLHHVTMQAAADYYEI